MARFRPITALSASIVLVCGATAVHAAEQEAAGQIARIQGSAMITDGARYVPAREGTVFQRSDRIIVLEDSAAELRFADGCEYTMTDSELLTIGEQSVCAQQADAAAGASAAGDGGALARPDAAQSAQAGRLAAAIERNARSQIGAAAGAGGGAAADAAGFIPAALGLGVAAVAAATNSSTGSADRDPVPLSR